MAHELVTGTRQGQIRAKAVLLIFTSLGSEWCQGCKDLDKEVCQTAQFQGYATTNFISVRIADSKANEALEEKYCGSSWPTLIVLDAKGKLQGRVPGYTKGTGYAEVGQDRVISHKGLMPDS